MQDLASKVGGGEQQRSCSPETSLQLQRYEMARYREKETTHLIGIWPPHPLCTLSFGGRIMRETPCFVTGNDIFPLKEDLGSKQLSDPP